MYFYKQVMDTANTEVKKKSNHKNQLGKELAILVMNSFGILHVYETNETLRACRQC